MKIIKNLPKKSWKLFFAKIFGRKRTYIKDGVLTIFYVLRNKEYFDTYKYLGHPEKEDNK